MFSDYEDYISSFDDPLYDAKDEHLDDAIKSCNIGIGLTNQNGQTTKILTTLTKTICGLGKKPKGMILVLAAAERSINNAVELEVIQK
jgi:hypothetical protein